MKNILLLLLLPSFLYSQTWIDKMQDPKSNFYDTQKEFNDYWENRVIEKGKGWKQFKRWENFIKPRVYPDGIQHPEILFNEYNNIKNSYNTFRMLPPNDWEQVGPDNVPLTSSGTKRGIGRVNTIAFHPTDTNIIYIGAPAGGFWRSLDHGQSWNTTTDFLSNLGVSDIAINPSNPDIIYIVTGDRDGGDTYSYGLMKSIDGGATFNATGLSFNVTNYYRGNRVLIDPNNTSNIIVATSNGIYRSVDSGVSFTHTYSGINMTDIEFHTANTDIIYGASKGNTSIYKSSDNGVTWNQAGSGLPATNNVVRACVAVTPDNPQVVYAMFGDNNNGFYGVYKSTNEGVTWVQQSNSPNLLGWSVNGSDSDGQAWYDLAFSVSPTDENTLFVGGVNCWKSSDGGQSWNINTHWYGANGTTYMHADEHMLKFNPLNNYLYSGNDGGLYYSDDNGDDWTDISDGLHITQFYSLGVSQTVQDKVITGSQDNGTFLKSNLYWDAVIGGDGMECIIDYTNSNIMYGALYYGDVRKSTNGGNSFSSIGPSNNGAWETPYELDKNNPEIIYIGYDELQKSVDGGSSWSQITNGETNGGTINEIGLSKSNPDVIFISDGSDIFRTTNAGISWQQVNNNLPNKSITYVIIHPNNENIVWVTLSGYTAGEKVYKSIDGGNNWVNISGTLPNIPVNCIELDNSSAYETVYIGTDLGVFTTDSTLNDWILFNSGLPNVIVNELEIQYQSNKLFAATFGRGLWSIDLEITSPPTANFSYSDSIFCNVPAEVSFINNSFYSNSYSWDFGDGNTSTSANPIHTYTSFGTFSVQLVATGPLGVDSILQQQIINIDQNNFCITTLPVSGAGITQTMCNGTLYDIGGPNGNYYDGNDSWITIAPLGSNQITLTFNSFDVEAPSSSTYCNWDYLEIFDGNDITSPSLGQYCNALTGSPGTITSSGGAITVFLHSDGSANGTGFEADWSCVFPTMPPVCMFDLSDSISCNQTILFTDLSSNGPTTWLWDFGDGNISNSQDPIHSYLNSGVYTVKLITTNAYGTDSLIINNAVTIIDVSLQTTDVISCGSDSFSLTASAASGVINWYDDISLQNLLDTGSFFTTPILNTTTSYFAQSVYEFDAMYAGPTDNTIGSGSFNQGNNYMIFDTYSLSKLVSVLVYANSDGYRTIELRNSSNIVLEDTTVFIPYSPNGIRVYINFDLNVQNNMQLGLSSFNNDLYRNNSGAVFPYSIPSNISITGASNQSTQDNWYFFYDWEVRKRSCESSVSEVIATIDNNYSNLFNITVCGSYEWAIDGIVYTSSGIYTNVTSGVSGCIYIDTLNLTIDNNLSSNSIITACGSYLWIVDGVNYTSSGVYTNINVDTSGCIQTDTLNLTIENTSDFTQNLSFCDGDSIIVGTNIYYAPGIYSDYFQTISGCDSTVYTILSVYPQQSNNQSILLCFGDSVIIGSNIYTQEGDFIDTLTNINNCDSIIYSSIQISSIDAEIIWNINKLEYYIINGIAISYLWNTGENTYNVTPNSSGVYWCIATDVNGCVSDTIFYNYSSTLLLNELSNSLNIFPNPTIGVFNITFFNRVRSILKITNVLGEDIYYGLVTSLGSISKQVDLSDYSSGIYIIELSTENGIINKKLIIE